MKCPKCATNIKRKYGMSCNCGYRFVFDPKVPPYISDAAFHRLVQSASSMETRYFTLESLYGVAKRKFPGKPAAWHWLLIISLFVLAAASQQVFFAVLASIYLIVIVVKSGKGKKIAMADLDSALKKWQNSALRSAFYLKKPSLTQPPAQYSEQDLYDYGVEKVILVDKDLTVDYLVLNKEHIEAKAIILSASGYPAYMQDIFKKVLDQQKDVPILLFHSRLLNKKQLLSQFKQATGIDLESRNVHDVAILEKQTKLKKLTRGFDHKELSRLTVEMLPFAAVAIICTLGIEALAEMTRASAATAYESALDDFG